MHSIIIGTAGHIDHGKTSLIKALHENNLQIQEERGITINLGFSNITNGSSNIAFIDVPGHENLVKTMISGAYGFDASLLVVAADDGLMPQTKEHIQILSLLDVSSIILCITKCDLVDDATKNTVLNQCLNYISTFKNLTVLNSFFLSINDTASINELKNYLFTLSAKPRLKNSLVRYYIDRVFTIKGAGTVVTGSLVGGEISKNEKLFCLNNSKTYQIKALQTHEQAKDFVSSPNRVAINLANAVTSELKKGFILSKKGFYRGFTQVDTVYFSDIEHGAQVLFCVGSAHVSARALLLSKDKECSYVTFKFQNEMFLEFNEPFVVLLNNRVVGGGRVLNPVEEPFKKPLKISLLNHLYKKEFLKAFEMLSSAHKHGFGLISSFQRFSLTHQEALEIAKELKNCFVDEGALCIYDKSALVDIKEFVKFVLSKNNFAIFSANSLNLRLNWASLSLIQTCLDELVAQNVIEKVDGVYIKKGLELSKISKSISDEIYKRLRLEGITPTAPYNIYEEMDIDRTVGDNSLKELTRSKKVVRLAHNLFIESQNLASLLEQLREMIKANGKINVTILKEKLNLSRKFAIAYLEYIDGFEDIKKIGNDRVLS